MASRYIFIIFLSLALLIQLFTCDVWAGIGQTAVEIESKKGKAAFSRDVNERTAFLFFKFQEIEETLILLDGKSALVLRKKPTSDDFTTEEVNGFLEEYKDPETSRWISINQTEIQNAKFFKLKDGKDLTAIWKDKMVMISTPQGIKTLNENQTIFYKFIDQLKGEVEVIKQENALLDREHQRQEYEIQIIEKGIKDPKEATLFALERKNAGFQVEFPFYFASLWHKNNPKEFMEWARTLRKEEYQLALDSTLEAAESDNTKDANDYVEKQMARGPKRTQALEVIAFKKATSNAEAAAEWASQFSKDDDARINVLNIVAIKWATLDPDKTIEWIIDISDTLPSELTGDCTSVSAFFTLTRLFERNPKLAFQKATELKNPDVRNPETYRIAGLWADKNLPELKKEIQEIDDKEKRKPAVMGLAEYMAKQKSPDFSGTADWLLRLESFPQAGPAPCGDLFSILISQWIKKDAKGCLSWAKDTLEKRKATNLQKTAILGYLESLQGNFR